MSGVVAGFVQSVAGGLKPKRVLMEAADHCTGEMDLGYEILMNAWAYLHYGDARYKDYCFAGCSGTAKFWDDTEEGVEYGTELGGD